MVGRVYTSIAKFINFILKKKEKNFTIAEIPFLGKIINNNTNNQINFQMSNYLTEMLN